MKTRPVKLRPEVFPIPRIDVFALAMRVQELELKVAELEKESSRKLMPNLQWRSGIETLLLHLQASRKSWKEKK